MRLDDMSPNARVFAKPDMRSSPNESVTNEVPHFRRRSLSEGEEGWWSVVSGTAAPSETLERMMRVSPQWAV